MVLDYIAIIIFLMIMCCLMIFCIIFCCEEYCCRHGNRNIEEVSISITDYAGERVPRR